MLNIIANAATGNHNGRVMIHHDHVTVPVSLRTRNTINNGDPPNVTVVLLALTLFVPHFKVAFHTCITK